MSGAIATKLSLRNVLAVLAGLAFILLALLAQIALAAQSTSGVDAAAIHQRLVIIDSHIDLPTADPDLILRPGTSSQFDLERARAGGLDGAALAVFVPQDDETPAKQAAARAAAEHKYLILLDLVAQNRDRATLATSPDQFRAAVEAGRFAVIPSFLNAYPLEGLADVDRWAARGIQLFGFVHAGHNAFADSSRPAFPRGDRPTLHGGLSPLGRETVGRLNDLGILIDVSQLSSAALGDVLAATRAPVVASHSSVGAIVPVPRNLSDIELDAIKANGGVVQINAFSAYVRRDRPETTQALVALQAEFGIDRVGGAALDEARRAEYTRRYYAIRATEPRATLAQFVDHIDYAVRRIGIDHVGISSDFNHGGGVIGWQDVSESAHVTAELLRRGYSEDQIAKLWGGNFLRVWRAARLAASPARTD